MFGATNGVTIKESAQVNTMRGVGGNIFTRL